MTGRGRALAPDLPSGGGSARLSDTRAERRGALPYSDVIRERWRHPRFRGPLEDANAVAEDVNPLCGDRVRFMLRLGADRVEAARFIGDSCAICTASADVLAEMLAGKRYDEARAIRVEDLLETLAADIRPTRMRCVTLPLTVATAALSEHRR
jgi:nitrogen fixation protein NifU and related proteins